MCIASLLRQNSTVQNLTIDEVNFLAMIGPNTLATCDCPGHLYQGRFKTFPVESDNHLLAVLRYVERNPLRALLCEHAEDWKYGSAWRTANGDAESRLVLSEWPVPRPRQKAKGDIVLIDKSRMSPFAIPLCRPPGVEMECVRSHR